MKTPKTTYATVDDYIASFPPDIRSKLETLQKTIKKAAPKAEELISYGMAGFKLNGPLIYFGVFKSHIGVYPGSIKLPLDKPIPIKLITEIVKQQVQRNSKKSTAKSKRK